MTPVALTIAGFDPSSGAGVTADCAVFAAHGLYGTACITALTVQSTRGVRSTTPLNDSLIRDTLQELEADLPPAGIKIGMLATRPIVRAVADFLAIVRRRRKVPIVLDPVLRSSSGFPLLEPEGIPDLLGRLLPLVGCITPNVAELALLLGREIPTSREAVEQAARELQERTGGRLHVVTTGGDQPEPHDLVLPAEGKALWLRGQHIASPSTHGTGCAFASALLAALMHGRGVEDSARGAKRYVEGAIRHAPGLGTGKGPMALTQRQQAAP